jgi:hypothetical protein
MHQEDLSFIYNELHTITPHITNSLFIDKINLRNPPNKAENNIIKNNTITQDPKI